MVGCRQKGVLAIFIFLCVVVWIYAHYFPWFTKVLSPITPAVQKIDPPPIYKHVTGKSCSLDNDLREIFIGLLTRWHNFATRNGIEYMMFYGSLLGHYRNKEATPWDRDVDVAVHERYYKIIKQASVQRSFTQKSDGIFRFIAQDEFETKPLNKRTNYNCKGQVVPDYPSDHCAFTGPMGRLLYGWQHIDFYHLVDLGKLIYDEATGLSYNRTDIYPLRRCSFMNISTWCPNNPRMLLEMVYGNIEPEMVCINGSWTQPV